MCLADFIIETYNQINMLINYYSDRVNHAIIMVTYNRHGYSMLMRSIKEIFIYILNISKYFFRIQYKKNKESSQCKLQTNKEENPDKKGSKHLQKTETSVLYVYMTSNKFKETMNHKLSIDFYAKNIFVKSKTSC